MECETTNSRDDGFQVIQIGDCNFGVNRDRAHDQEKAIGPRLPVRNPCQACSVIRERDNIVLTERKLRNRTNERVPGMQFQVGDTDGSKTFFSNGMCISADRMSFQLKPSVRCDELQGGSMA